MASCDQVPSRVTNPMASCDQVPSRVTNPMASCDQVPSSGARRRAFESGPGLMPGGAPRPRRSASAKAAATRRAFLPRWNLGRAGRPRFGVWLRASDAANGRLNVVDLLFDLLDEVSGHVADLLLHLLAGQRGEEQGHDGTGEGARAERESNL